MKLAADPCEGCNSSDRLPHFHSDGTIAVSSSNGVDWYTVVITCTCKAGENGAICKHLEAAAAFKREHKSQVMKRVAAERKERKAAVYPEGRIDAIGPATAPPRKPSETGVEIWERGDRIAFPGEPSLSTVAEIMTDNEGRAAVRFAGQRMFLLVYDLVERGAYKVEDAKAANPDAGYEWIPCPQCTRGVRFPAGTRPSFMLTVQSCANCLGVLDNASPSLGRGGR